MSRVTTKGQVTIPKDIRDALGLAPGTHVGFRKEGSKFVLVKEIGETPDDYLAEWVGRVKPFEPNQTVDEMIDDMRGGKARDRR
ncbi:MAG: AbrB/MazE/SpoVT family DNA-binding domain-containing protein [Deltaproteobacteria bacterium]|nr:AbrB/MazE/SpoVT family DNA-binding domain-containing protein [Deltaproteobacteria bacterium]